MAIARESGTEPSVAQPDEELLHGIDEVARQRGELREEARRAQASDEAKREAFRDGLAMRFRDIVRPTMQVAVDRLRADGGDGRIKEELPEDDPHHARMTLWMTLDGPLVDPPLQDRDPYLRLETSQLDCRVHVWAGDYVRGEGVAREVARWSLDEITVANVSAEIVAVLRRAVAHGVQP